uniref:GST C-terminal domain-containing protein n=1 Tax=Aegilops tauschii subsp. strangulata TaxID=200361 RepID=A0A453GMR0_AEGTS
HQLVRQYVQPPRGGGPAAEAGAVRAHCRRPSQQEPTAAHSQPHPQEGPRAPPCMKSLWAALWMEPSEAQRRSLVEAKGSLALLEEHLGERSFFGGDSIGLVDIAASVLAHWLGVMEKISEVTVVTDEEFPALCHWARRYVSDEDVKTCLPERGELVAMFSGCKEMFRSMAMACHI